MANSFRGIAQGAVLSMAPHPAAAQPWTGCTKRESQSVAQPAPRKRGLGLGGAMKAADDTGVRNLFTGGMLGRGGSAKSPAPSRVLQCQPHVVTARALPRLWSASSPT